MSICKNPFAKSAKNAAGKGIFLILYPPTGLVPAVGEMLYLRKAGRWLTVQDIKKWNEAAADYQRVFLGGMSEYNRSLIGFLLEEGMLYPGCRVVDVGCGIGKYGTYFAAMGCDVTLTDISPGMLELARKNMASFDSPWAAFECDFEAAHPQHPLFSKRYDLGFSTMCPAIHDRATVRKLSEAVDGGCFISHFVKWEEPLRQRFFDRLGLKPEEDMNRFSVHMDELCQAVIDAGYAPRIRHVPYNWCDERTDEEAADYLLKRVNAEVTDEIREKAISVAAELCDERGVFSDEVHTTVAWLWWKTKGE